jgi:hypothetical protein
MLQEESRFFRQLIADRVTGRSAATQKCYAHEGPSLDGLEKVNPMLALMEESGNAAFPG